MSGRFIANFMMEQRRKPNLAAMPARTVYYAPFSLRFSRKSIFPGFVFFCVFFLLFFTFFAINLPGLSDNDSVTYMTPKRLDNIFHRYRNPDAISDLAILGGYGEIMVDMLADDLPFTVFVPSEKYFEQILGPKIDVDDKVVKENFTEEMIQKSDSEVDSKSGNVMATISRILGFSAIPLPLPSRSVPLNDELVVDSLSGFRVHLARVSNGILFVNNMSCEATDRRRGEIIIHVVRGVIMDAEFEQSVRPQDEDSE